MNKITQAKILVALTIFCAAFSINATAQQQRKVNPSEVNETLIGDIVADAVRASLGADAALINAGMLSAPEPPEAFTEKNVDSSLAFPGDIVVLIKLKGGDLVEALEKSVSALPRRSSGFLQVSGITFTADLNKKSGSRVSNVRVAGSAIDNDTVYTIAVTDFLVSGYPSLKNGKIVEDSEITIREAVLRNAVVPKSGKMSAGSRIQLIQPKTEK